MELIFDKKEDLSTSRKSDFWNDSLIEDFYSNYYNSLNSKELDKEFNEDIKFLSETLSKLPVAQRKAFI